MVEEQTSVLLKDWSKSIVHWKPVAIENAMIEGVVLTLWAERETAWVAVEH